MQRLKTQINSIYGFRELLIFCASTIMVIISEDYSMFYQIFLSPQVKRNVIISNKYDMYELPHELSNELTLTIFIN